VNPSMNVATFAKTNRVSSKKTKIATWILILNNLLKNSKRNPKEKIIIRTMKVKGLIISGFIADSRCAPIIARKVKISIKTISFLSSNS